MTRSGAIANADLFRMAVEGAAAAHGLAKKLLDEAIAKHGAGKTARYPDTAYGLPIIDAWTGIEVRTLSDLPKPLDECFSKVTSEHTLENAKRAGESLLYSAEIIEALKYIDNDNPYNYPGQTFCGFVSDRIIRKLGFALVDETIPCAAVIVGKASDPKALVKLVRQCQGMGMIIFASGDCIGQLGGEGVQMGLDSMLYPVGDLTQLAHAANFAVRAALAFGGIQRGQRAELLAYLKKRPRAFVLHLGPLDPIRTAAEFGVIFMGSPTVTDQPVEDLTDPEDPSRILFTSEPDYDRIVQKALEIRGITIKASKVPVPVPYGPAFEGESIRKEDMHFEAGGTRTPALEWLRMRGEKEVLDGRIEVHGAELDQIAPGQAVPLAIEVEVYGRKMAKDFESVLERRIHQFINFAQGVMHLGQRNTIWIRISREAVAAGFRLSHLGQIIVHRLKEDFPGIVTRVQVRLTTDEKKVREMLAQAQAAYDERDDRMRNLTDESVDTFYSCTLCQSFAPNHLCVVTPQRLGLCGAVNWLDAKASNEITPTGPNQPLPKGKELDAVLGQWESINDKVKELSRGRLERFSAYSIIVDPMTSCGCFECIIAIVPEANGVLVVNREYAGDTPIGMRFSTLAGTVGGGNQVPGFLGVGRKYIVSKKFITADGGFTRIVWMPKMLKEQMAEALSARAKELDVPDFVEKIADETTANTAEELVAFLEKNGHPAPKMKPIM